MSRTQKGHKGKLVLLSKYGIKPVFMVFGHSEKNFEIGRFEF